MGQDEERDTKYILIGIVRYAFMNSGERQEPPLSLTLFSNPPKSVHAYDHLYLAVDAPFVLPELFITPVNRDSGLVDIVRSLHLQLQLHFNCLNFKVFFVINVTLFEVHQHMG